MDMLTPTTASVVLTQVRFLSKNCDYSRKAAPRFWKVFSILLKNMMEDDETDYIELPFDIGDASLLDRMLDYIELRMTHFTENVFCKTAVGSLAQALNNGMPGTAWLPKENAMLALCHLLNFCDYLDVPQELFVLIRFKCIWDISNSDVDFGPEETLATIAPSVFNLAVQHIPMSKLYVTLNKYKTLVKKHQPRLVIVFHSLNNRDTDSDHEKEIIQFFFDAWKIPRLYNRLKNERPLALFEELWITAPSRVVLPLLILFPHITRIIRHSYRVFWPSTGTFLVRDLCVVKTFYVSTHISILEVCRKKYEIQFLKYQLLFGCLGSDTPRRISIPDNL